MRRFGVFLLAVLMVMGLVAEPAPAVATHDLPRQGKQGLQGGWALNDSGQIDFLHSTNQQLKLMQDAGAGWVRINFRLGACFEDWVTPSRNRECSATGGKTALELYKKLVDNAKKRKLKVLGLLSNESWPGNQADWTENNAENVPGGNGFNAYVEGFATQAAAVVIPYFARRGVTVWEIWNEPNAWTSNPAPGVYEGGSFLYPSNFAWLLKRTYEEVKPRAPSVQLMLGGVFATNVFGTAAVPATITDLGKPFRALAASTRRRGTYNPRGLIAGIQAAGPVNSSGGNYVIATHEMGRLHAGWLPGEPPFDLVGQHLYLDPGRQTSARTVASYLETLYGVYAAQQTPGTEVPRLWVTEVGWSTAPGYVGVTTQAKNLEIAYRQFRKTSFLERAFWFNVQDIPEGNLFLGLVKGDGKRKKSWDAYRRYARY